MAPPRKKRATAAADKVREYKVRMPEDVAHWIEERANRDQVPQNRVIINALARYPDLEAHPTFREMMQDNEVILARYSARIIVADLTDDLLGTLREMVKADEADKVGEVRAKVQKVRVILKYLEKHERGSKE